MGKTMLRREMRRHSKRDAGSQLPAARRSCQALRALRCLRSKGSVKSDRRRTRGGAFEATKPASVRTRRSKGIGVAHPTENLDISLVQRPRKVYLTRHRVNALGGTTETHLRIGSDDGNQFSSAAMEVPTEIITRSRLRKMLSNATHERRVSEAFERTVEEKKKVDRCTQQCGKDVNNRSGKRGNSISRRVTRSMDEKQEEIQGKESREASEKPPHNTRNDGCQRIGWESCEVSGIGSDDRGKVSIPDRMAGANAEQQANAEQKNGYQVVGEGKVIQSKGRDTKTFRREDRVKMESEESEYLKGVLQSLEDSRGVRLSLSGPITRARQVKQKRIEMGTDMKVIEVMEDSDKMRKAVMAHKAMQEIMEKNHSKRKQNTNANNVNELRDMVETRRFGFPKGHDEKGQLGVRVRWVRNWTQEKDGKHGCQIDGQQNTDSSDFGKVIGYQTSRRLMKHEQQQQKRRRFTAENWVNNPQNGVGKESCIMKIELPGSITRGMKQGGHAQARGQNKCRRQMNEQSDNGKGVVDGVDGKQVSNVPLTATRREQTTSVLAEKTDNTTGRKLSMNHIDATDKMKALNQPVLLLRDNALTGSGLKRARDVMSLKENMLLDDIAVDTKAAFVRGNTSDEERSLKTGLESAKNAFHTGEERCAGMQHIVNFDEPGQGPKRPKKDTSRVHEGEEYVYGKTLKGESVSDTLEKASVIMLEHETIQTKVGKKGGLVRSVAAENSSKGALAVLTNCVNQKSEAATAGDDSGIVYVDTQNSSDNLLEDSADTYIKPARVHLNSSFPEKELEQQEHKIADFRKFRNGSMKHFESGMPPVFNIRKEESRNVALAEAPIADKQNALQSAFREDHICIKSPVDDRNHCFSSSKRKMARMMSGMLRDSEVGNQATHYDPVVDDGVCRVDSKRKYYWVAVNPKETGGRQMRPRPLDVDQPLNILVEGCDQEYCTYDGGLFHQMVQEQEADWAKKNFENVHPTGDAVQAIVIPSFQVLPELQEQKRAKLDYVLPQSYIRYTDIAVEGQKAEYDRDDEDEEWLQDLNKTKMTYGMPVMSDDQFEKIVDFFENKSAQLVNQQCSPTFSNLESMKKDGNESDKSYQNENPCDNTVLGKLPGGSEVCCICNGGENSVRNPVFKCSGCNIYVHQSCYGIQEPVSGYELVANFTNNWYCRKCEVAAEGTTELCCALCHKRGGALKPGVDPSKWVHVVCALYTNETFFVNPDAMEPVDGVTAAEARAKKATASMLVLWCGGRLPRTLLSERL